MLAAWHRSRRQAQQSDTAQLHRLRRVACGRGGGRRIWPWVCASPWVAWSGRWLGRPGVVGVALSCLQLPHIRDPGEEEGQGVCSLRIVYWDMDMVQGLCYAIGVN